MSQTTQPITVVEGWGEDFRAVRWTEPHDQILLGVRTPDGREFFEPFEFFTSPRFLAGHDPRNQEQIIRSWQDSFWDIGVQYDPEVHGNLTFIRVVRQVRISETEEI